MATKPDRVSINAINATMDRVHNQIVANASPAFRDKVPLYENKHSLPKIGEVLTGNPGLANEWISELTNRVGIWMSNTLYYSNQLGHLKKGDIGYGETVESIFTEIPNAIDYSPEKAHYRELKRSPAKVLSEFYLINFEATYKTTTQLGHIDRAFTSLEAMGNFLSEIVTRLATAFEVDDRNMTLYTLTRGFLSGGIRQEVVAWDPEDLEQSAKNLAVAARTHISKMANPRKDYNHRGVLTAGQPNDMWMIIDSETEAVIDVEQLASAFNTDRASIQARTIVIDDWDSIDFDRLAQVNDATDMLDPYTVEEFDYLRDGKLKALIFHEGYAQLYNKRRNMSTTTVNIGEYVNHHLHIHATYARSGFHPAVALVTDVWSPTPGEITFHVTGKQTNDNFDVVSLKTEDNVRYKFDAGREINAFNGIAVMEGGAVTAPRDADPAQLNIEVDGGVIYDATQPFDVAAARVGDEITFTERADDFEEPEVDWPNPNQGPQGPEGPQGPPGEDAPGE